MTKYSLPYFAEIDLTALDDYYEVDIDLNGNTINIDINFENKSSDRNKFDTVRNFLDKINKFDQQNKSYIDNDFKKPSVTLDYITFYFEELDQDELSDIVDFNNAIVAKERQLLNKLKLIRVGIYPDHNSECYGVFDYSIDIDGEPCNELLVVKIDERGNLDHITWES
ncbi:MAG: DUF2004 domain-containing protein [Acidobacteriota bacterium]|jgi:hypothetical protein|nr:DUF2004 domain-containing protein [Acidobacteriota bacterium]